MQDLMCHFKNFQAGEWHDWIYVSIGSILEMNIKFKGQNNRFQITPRKVFS